MKRLLSLLAAFAAPLGLFVLFFFVVNPVQAVNPAATFNVNSFLDAVDVNPGDGTCETGAGNGICTLRAAIMEANNLAGEDTVILPAGLYVLTQARSENPSVVGDLNISQSLNIVGAGSTSTIIDGNNLGRIFLIDTLNNQTITITGVTIRNGNGNGGGGLCNCSTGSHVVLSDTIVSDNTTPNQGGGGIRNIGQMTIINSSIVSNTTPFGGGGLENEDNAVMVISNSTISQNVAQYDGLGGGISNKGILTITGSTIWRNEVHILDMGASGAGIFNNGNGKLWLVNSTVSENTAYGAGGGLFSWNTAYMTVTNSTIFSNSVTNSGSSGGRNIHVLAGNIKLQNSIVAGEHSINCSGTVTSAGYNLENWDSCGFNQPGDIVNTNPLLGDFQDNGGSTFTHALLPNSPAIDTGNNTVCPATDQRGVSRPVDGDGDGNPICDIGAYETEPTDFNLVKMGPTLVTSNSFITYTLIATNNLSITVTNLVLTDRIPVNATYISGGTQAGDIVSWTLPELEAGATFSRSFVVTATQTITNEDYRLSASGGFSTTGDIPVVTIVSEPITGLTANNDSPTPVGSTTNLMAVITTGSDVVFDWDFGDGTTGSGANPSHVYPNVGQFTAVVTATNPLGSVTATTSITITDVPISGLSAENNSPTNLGDTTSLTASVANGSNVVFDWDFGDGTTGSGANTSHVYPSVGQYTAVVTATNSLGSEIATTLITITDVPIGSLSTENNSPTILGDSTTLTASVTSGTNVSFDWDFGDGTTGSGAVVEHTYPDVGQYTAVVTASNSVGEVVLTTVVTIENSAWEIFMPIVLRPEGASQQQTETQPNNKPLPDSLREKVAIKPNSILQEK